MAHAFITRFLTEAQPYINPKYSYGLAVSGGGDSVALLHLFHAAFPTTPVHVLHVNHNLREESAAEAAFVQQLAANYNYPYHFSVWEEAHKAIQDTNTLQAARTYRQHFFADMARKHTLTAVLTAHTQTDIVENTLMRLGRGSGLTGLAAMPTEHVITALELTLLRLLLGFSRDELRTYMEESKYTWCEDPTNNNRRYLRPRVRQLLPTLEENGLAVSAIADAAQALRRAENALSFSADELFTTHMTYKADEATLCFPLNILFTAQEEIQLRVLGHIIRTLILDTSLLPRTKKRTELLTKLRRNETATLGGVKFSPHAAELICTREGE